MKLENIIRSQNQIKRGIDIEMVEKMSKAGDREIERSYFLCAVLDLNFSFVGSQQRFKVTRDPDFPFTCPLLYIYYIDTEIN